MHAKKRPYVWKSQNLSMRNLLILLKVVLSSRHVYFFSFFKASTNIISKMQSQLKYFWGWVTRKLGKFIGLNEIMCQTREKGGLDVFVVRTFNYALLKNSLGDCSFFPSKWVVKW